MKSKKKVLITGGAGFIGFHLSKKLLSEGFKVDLIDNLSRGKKDLELNKLLKSKNAKFKNVDLSQSINLKNKNYDYIFHLAAIVGVKNVIENPSNVLKKNIKLLMNLLEFSSKQKSIKRFFFLSTSEVYAGSLKNKLLKFPTNEKNILSLENLGNKRSTYMLSKIYGEALCHFSGVPFTILRPHNIFGERMGMSHVIPELTMKILKKDKNLTVYNYNHKRAFCYIDDAIEMIIKIMYSKKTLDRTYNLGDPRKEISISELAKKIIKILKKNKKIKFKKLNNFSPTRRLPSMRSLSRDINLKFKSSFDFNLLKTVEWYKKNIKR
jgi:nucleoside-diphosphate-sugar epimerase